MCLEDTFGFHRELNPLRGGEAVQNERCNVLVKVKT